MKMTNEILLSMLLNELKCFVLRTENYQDILISRLVTDSRTVVTGDCFIAINGITTDGNCYIENVLRAGVSVVFFSDLSVIDKFFKKYPETVFVQFKQGDDYRFLATIAELFYQRPANKLRLIAVTGTNGKTTTCYLINHILRSVGVKTTLIGTVAYDIDGEIFSATHTTPDPLQLQRILQQSVDAGVETVVMEVSSHAADQNRTGSALFEIVAFTNLTGEHLDYHQSMENYFTAKRSIFSNSLANDGTAVINSDDAWGRKLISDFSGLTYGFNENISDYKIIDYGSTFRLDGGIEIEVPLYGKFNIANTSAAFKVVQAYGITDKKIIDALKQFPGVPGRLEAVHLKTGALAFVDYAHTDDALRNVGNALSELPHQRLITIFGCGGDRDRTKRPRMATAASEFSDVIIVTADNSRNESIDIILDDIVKGFPKGCQYDVVADRGEAISKAVELSNAGDIILVAGKGHENYQLENGLIKHFSDVEELRRFIKS